MAVIRDFQYAVQLLGQAVTYVRADGTVRAITARVRYLTAQELANALEQWALEITVDARDFSDGPPLKGDTIVTDNTRRGVVMVREYRASGLLIGYRCGVQG